MNQTPEEAPLPQPHLENQNKKTDDPMPPPETAAAEETQLESLPPSPQISPNDLLKALQALQSQTPYRPIPAASIIPPASGPQLGLSIQTQIVQPNVLAPAILDTLEKHSPGAVTRLMTMAEKQQDAVIAANQSAQRYTKADISRAHYIAAGLSTLAIAAALYSEKLGYPWVASAFLTFPVAAVVNAIVGAISKSK